MKNILIIGGSSGLGKELAKEYGNLGEHVIIVGRDEDKLKAACDEINRAGGTSDSVICDVKNLKDIRVMADTVIDKYGRVDVLVNSAGVGYFGALRDHSEHEIEDMMDVNVKGVIYVVREFIDSVNDQIINIISTAGLRGKPRETVYCASKFAIRGFTEALIKEYEHQDLNITAVYMGGMDTPFWDTNDHIKDKSRLKSPSYVAKKIMELNDGRNEIIVE